ncbi:hypothetical protein EJB05_48943, partial [Eragrostis curvula]
MIREAELVSSTGEGEDPVGIRILPSHQSPAALLPPHPRLRSVPLLLASGPLGRTDKGARSGAVAVAHGRRARRGAAWLLPQPSTTCSA